MTLSCATLLLVIESIDNTFLAYDLQEKVSYSPCKHIGLMFYLFFICSNIYENEFMALLQLSRTPNKPLEKREARDIKLCH